METIVNNLWNNYTNPLVSIIVPVYNRRHTLPRTIQSIKNQTFKDIECIIVDDGSTEPADDIIKAFMEEEVYPVCYIKKENGGVHTARNVAIKNTNGNYIVNIDSDDELTIDAISILWKRWDWLAQTNSGRYREIVGRCIDDNEMLVGKLFPDDINNHEWSETRRIAKECGGECLAMWDAEIMKKNPWPEPEGITFVTEDVLWDKLRKEYKSYYINEVVRIYHSDSGNSIINDGKKNRSVQYCKNIYWNNGYLLNNNEYPLKERIRLIAIFSVFENCLIKKDALSKIRLNKKVDKILKALCVIPAKIIAVKYINTKMKTE